MTVNDNKKVKMIKTYAIINHHKVYYEDFPRYVSGHLQKVICSKEMESRGKLLIKNEFPSEDLIDFIEAVCTWGGRYAITGKILDKNNNSTKFIRRCFKKAYSYLSNGYKNVDAALDCLLAIHGLGISFASKHLRFVSPKLCPILDSNISEFLNYSLTTSNYAKYSILCTDLAKILKDLKIGNPMKRPKKTWYAADVDMALFAKKRGWWR